MTRGCVPTKASRRSWRAVRMPVKAGLAPHAPYSVSPDLFRAVADAASAHGPSSSVHLGESPEEVEFLMTGRGGIAETLKHLGAWNDAWTIPAGRILSTISTAWACSARSAHCSLRTADAVSSEAPRGARLRDCQLPAQQPLGRRRRSAYRFVSTRRAPPSCLGPTAWPASPT